MRRNKRGRTEVEMVQKSEEGTREMGQVEVVQKSKMEQGRKDRGRGGAEE